MTQWYYSSNGKAQGPVTSEFLIENLRKGQLTLVDLVFRAGDAGWVTIGEIPEFREAYNALPLQTPPANPPVDEVTISASEVAKAAAHATPVNEPFEIHAFKKMISMADSRTVQPLSRPQSGWPRDWQLSSSWIVLKRRDDGSGFDQDGPYSAEQIIDMIGQGKVEYSQYCWKPGYTRWFRIGNLPEFDRRKRDRDNDMVNQIVPVPEILEALPALTREELLSGVERLRQARKVQEAPPAGTDGRDLVRNAIDVTPIAQPVVPKPVVQQAAPAVTAQNAYQPVAWTKASADTYAQSQAPVTAEALEEAFDVPEPKPWTPSANVTPWSVPEVQRPQAAAPAASVPASTPAQAYTAAPQNPNPFAETATGGGLPGAMKPAAKSNRSFVRLGVAGAIAGLAVVALLQYSNQKPFDEVTERTPAAKQPLPKKPAAPKPEPEQGEQIPNPAESTSSVAPVAPPTVAQNPGSKLEILPLKLTTEPTLTFQTDAGVGQTIDVTLSAKTGEILRYGSYYNTFKVTRDSGEIATLSLSKLELPAGTYTVTAVVGTATASTEIFVGVKGPEFLSQLERHIKGLSYRQQVERKSMFYGSQKLADLTQRLLEKNRVLKGQPKTWKKELATWRLAAKEAAMPVLQLAASPRNETAYFPQLAAFQLTAEKLAALANELDSAMDQKREIASAEADSVLTALSQIQSETATLTVATTCVSKR